MAQLVTEYAISDEPLGNQAIYIDGVDSLLYGPFIAWNFNTIKRMILGILGNRLLLQNLQIKRRWIVATITVSVIKLETGSRRFLV